MTLLFHCPWENAAIWRAELSAALAGEDLVELSAGDPQAEAAVVWKPPAAAFRRAPNLKLICALGAGVEDMILGAEALPEGVRLTRLVDPVMAERMALYVLATVLRKHRDLDRYERQQRARRWLRVFHADAAVTKVAVLGQGSLGRAVTGKLAAAGFQVAGWARSPRPGAPWPVLTGPSGLQRAVADAAFVVAVLPLTSETEGLLAAPLFAAMAEGAYLVNVGRGAQLVEDDLLAALDRKHLSGAALDVFAEEPLSAESPLWARPEILITPHVASLSNPASGARALAAEIESFRANGSLQHEVFPARQY